MSAEGSHIILKTATSDALKERELRQIRCGDGVARTGSESLAAVEMHPLLPRSEHWQVH